MRGLHPIVRQHTVGEWDKGRRWARLVPFHVLEEGEYPAIVRSNEIQMCGLFSTSETVSEDCVPTRQSENRNILRKCPARSHFSDD